jgi:hypothetical protein
MCQQMRVRGNFTKALGVLDAECNYYNSGPSSGRAQQEEIMVELSFMTAAWSLCFVICALNRAGSGTH